MSTPKWLIELQREMAETDAAEAEALNEWKASIQATENILNRVRVTLTAGI